MYADLHIHTNFSDGIYSPKEILIKAEKANLKTIAITDHDNFSGSIQARDILKGSKFSIDLIPGVEFSCTYGSNEYHIIGLFIDFYNEEIIELIEAMQKKRLDSIKKILFFLKSKDINISIDNVISNSKGSIGRPHIALELIKQGYVKSVNEAFEKYLSNKHLKDIKEPRMTVEKAIEVIKISKGISIWAHPNISEKIFLSEINLFKNMGLSGIEVHSPRYGLHRQKELLEICKSLDLVVSGGSDFHGIHEGIEISQSNAISEIEYESIIKLKKSL
tara:strand:- start:53951 stop:54778 length:828 start_codon:yes stop_codon:yes gene_type:complete